MKLYEMEGFLRGKCVPGDLLVNETNAQYLVRKFTELNDCIEVTTAALREKTKQCDALANELNAVEAIHNDAVFITDDHYDQCPPQVQKIIRKLAVMVLPSTDEFLREVRAQGVGELAQFAGEEYQRHKAVGDRTGQRKWKSFVLLCADFANQIRQGGAA
ncbi:hypothetical protein G4U62_12265 [Cronobacter sakazakii]|uniref:hypothetical protein n=1 Tax=Cronobacter sakazakii TaxID=28141 RepID=UPI001C0BA74E|nr:hypothetical protein [Cronobacter sakazakii]EKY2079372.1 hypothetical protein [Cronobacter sakazakii]QWR81221.1 hypothetical protein G4U62_12265 [Cronobacter sakazakii]